MQSRINSMVMVVLILCLAGLLGWLSTRYEWQYDWTRSARHTLSAASIEILEKMQGPVEITAYAREEPGLREIITKIVARYQHVKADIVLHFVNPDAVPDEVRNLGISINGELVIRYQDRSQHVHSDSEEEFTNALQRLARGAERWLAFIEGHGERSPLGQANFDLGNWVRQLDNRGFKTQPINLADIQAIPENTQVLIIAGPQVDLLPGETKLIEEYIDRGGNMLWLLDPPGKLFNLENLANQLKINITPGTVIDFAGRLIGLDDPTIVLETGSLYPPHPATADFKLTTFFPTATAIATGDDTDWRVTPLLSSGDHTWLETGKLEGEVAYDEGVDHIGPLNIGISLDREKEFQQGANLARKMQRVVVIGDGDFLSNSYVTNSGNMDLGIRIMNWLSNDDDFISIPANLATDTQLDLTPVAAGVIGFGFLIILPLALLMTGFTIWWRRRKQ
jgi:ABC-type uncharacterized transport system involved in gliding motility auxiliary subunit